MSFKSFSRLITEHFIGTYLVLSIPTLLLIVMVLQISKQSSLHDINSLESQY